MKNNYSSYNRKKKSKLKGCLSKLGIILLILIIGFLILLYIRYDAWFSNPPEPTYQSLPRIERITLTPTEDFSKGRVITWKYDSIAHPSFVELSILNDSLQTTSSSFIPAEGKDVRTRSGHAYYYHSVLADLKEGQSYKYRVISGVDSSEWKTFKLPITSDTLRFIYMGDVQDPIGTESDSLFSMLRKQNLPIDFFAFGGDQVERPMDEYWNIWYNSLGDWTGTIPFISVAGNHEYLKGINKNLDQRWIPQHNYPENGPEGFKGKSYYIDFPLVRFVVLDSNIIQWPNAVWKHKKWLEDVLSSAPQPWKIVMFHHAVQTVREGRMHPMMRYIFRPILESNNVDLVLQGHDHAYSRIITKEDNEALKTPMYVISSASPKLYRNGFDDVHDKLGSGLALYQTIEITPHDLNYKSYQFDGSLYDEVNIEIDSLNAKKIEDRGKDIEELFFYDEFGTGSKAEKKRNKYKENVEKRKSKKQVNNK